MLPAEAIRDIQSQLDANSAKTQTQNTNTTTIDAKDAETDALMEDADQRTQKNGGSDAQTDANVAVADMDVAVADMDVAVADMQQTDRKKKRESVTVVASMLLSPVRPGVRSSLLCAARGADGRQPFKLGG